MAEPDPPRSADLDDAAGVDAPAADGQRVELDEASEILSGRLPDDWRSPNELRALFAQSPNATWVIDVERGHVFANAATAALFHVDTDDASALGHDVATMLHPSERERTVRELQQLLSGEIDRVSRIKHYVRPDGTEFDGQLESVPLLNDDGKPWAILSSCRDVTQQREAERALVQREAWFEALVRHNVDAIVVLDQNATLTYISPSADGLVGSVPGEWLNRNALEIVHPDDFDVVAESFGNTASTPGTAVPLRFRIVRTDGQVRMVEAVATNLLDDPAVQGVVVNLRDLTERQEVGTALEVSENRFRKMLENISDTVTLVDGSGQVIRTTGNVKSILGYPKEFWTVRNAFDVAHPDDLDLIRSMFVQLLETPGGDVSGEFRVRHASGHHEYVEANAINLLEDPDVGAIVVTTRNITPRKHAEQELAEARDQALRALEVRNEFVASVSHELRTPIHGILGLAELLATSTDATDEVVHLAVSIRRATESLRLVLDDILDFTKIEAGRLELNEQPTSLREIIDDIEGLFGPQSTAKGIALRVSADDTLPATFITDGLRLRQVLNNLVSNAVKFTSRGQVSVVFRREADVSGDRLRVQVTDTGIGMSPEIIQRVFDPFSQAHANTAREYGGTGLGLTIARRLIDMMNGVLLVDSEVGRGTAFDVAIPLRTRGVKIATAHDELEHRDLASEQRRVLVVEDNTVNQLLVGRQLERLGYEPVVVGSGEAAVDLFGREAMDAVLMDWQMPGMDGIEAAGQLRRIEKTDGRDRVPIIAMTASAMPGDRERCLEADMDDFIAKPVNLATLGRTLAAWLYPAEESADESRPLEAPQPATTVPVDSGVLDRLLEELDDPALVATVVATYRRELPGRVEAIEDAARAGDLGELKAVAHTLKSTSAALGAELLAELCRELEDLAKTDTPAFGSLEPLLSKVGAERTRVDRALEAEAARFQALSASAS